MQRNRGGGRTCARFLERREPVVATPRRLATKGAALLDSSHVTSATGEAGEGLIQEVVVVMTPSWLALGEPVTDAVDRA